MHAHKDSITIYIYYIYILYINIYIIIFFLSGQNQPVAGGEELIPNHVAKGKSHDDGLMSV